MIVKIIQFDPIYNSTGNYCDYKNGILYITTFEQIIYWRKNEKMENPN